MANARDLATVVAADLTEVLEQKVSVNGKGLNGTLVVDTVLNAITEYLASGEDVKLNGFGTFSVAERAARKGVNPKLLSELKKQGVDEASAKAQAQIDIAASKAPKFKPQKGLKDAVNS